MTRPEGGFLISVQTDTAGTSSYVTPGHSHSGRQASIDAGQLGAALENRDILGRIGLALEREFGTDITHIFATRELPAGGSYSFGSVRRNAAAIKRDGGMLIGISNPLTPVRRYDFDDFPTDLIDLWIDNDAQHRGLHGAAGLADLEGKVVAALESWNDPALFPVRRAVAGDRQSHHRGVWMARRAGAVARSHLPAAAGPAEGCHDVPAGGIQRTSRTAGSSDRGHRSPGVFPA